MKKKNKKVKVRTIPWCASVILMGSALVILEELEEHFLMERELINLKRRVIKLESKL
jgi:hypothetical protein